MKAHVLGSGMNKAEEVVNYVLMKARQFKGLTSERSTVYLFALLMADSFFYDPDNEFGTFMRELIFGIIEVFEKTLD